MKVQGIRWTSVLAMSFLMGAEAPWAAGPAPRDEAARPAQLVGDPAPMGAAAAPAMIPSGTRYVPNCEAPPVVWEVDDRMPFQSDHAFDGFVAPITNPINAKDPRSLTEARVLFLSNWGRSSTPVLGAGNFQVYALQLRLALTDRLQFIADKDGIADVHPMGGANQTGLLNLAAGLKYALIRDVERKQLFSVTVQYEAPTGEANVFQNHGNGVIGLFGTYGKEFGDNNHLIVNFGQNQRISSDNSSYFFTSVHLDKRFGRFVPLWELNWYHYNQSGTFLPAAVGIEGDGLLNLGTAGVAGNDLVFMAVGAKYTLGKCSELGVAYEFPVSSRQDLLSNRLVAEWIIRY